MHRYIPLTSLLFIRGDNILQRVSESKPVHQGIVIATEDKKVVVLGRLVSGIHSI